MARAKPSIGQSPQTKVAVSADSGGEPPRKPDSLGECVDFATSRRGPGLREATAYTPTTIVADSFINMVWRNIFDRPGPVTLRTARAGPHAGPVYGAATSLEPVTPGCGGGQPQPGAGLRGPFAVAPHYRDRNQGLRLRSRPPGPTGREGFVIPGCREAADRKRQTNMTMMMMMMMKDR